VTLYVKDIAGAPYKIKKKRKTKRQNRRHSVVWSPYGSTGYLHIHDTAMSAGHLCKWTQNRRRRRRRWWWKILLHWLNKIKVKTDAFSTRAFQLKKLRCVLWQGVSHTPSGGLIPPTFAQHPPASGGKEGERGRGGRGKGKGTEGLVDTPHVPNPEKYPFCGLLWHIMYANIQNSLRNSVARCPHITSTKFHQNQT